MTTPMAICESKLPEPSPQIHYRQMVEEAKLLVLGESLHKAFFRHVNGTGGHNFKVAGIFYAPL